MLARKIALNTIISAAARVIGIALSLIILGLLARYLGQASFGNYTTVLAFLYIFNVFADLGLYSITVREISREGAEEEKIVSNAFTLRLMAGFLMFGLAALIVFLFPYPPEIKWGIALTSLGFWALSNAQVLIGVFQKYLKMDRVATSELAGRLVHLILVFFFIWQKAGFLSILTAYVGGAVINFILIFLLSQKYIPVKIRFDFSFWKKLLKESYPLAVAAVLVMIYFKLDTVMLSLMKESQAVGIYGLAYKILESLIFFPAMFVGLIMPLLSKYALENREKFKQVIQKAFDFLIILTIPLVIGTLFLSRKIIILLGGQDFVQSAGVLNVLIVATGIIFLATLFFNIIIAVGRQKLLTWIYLFGAIVNIGANLIFIPKYSYYGAAGTTVLTEFLVTFLMIVAIIRTAKYFPSLKRVGRVLIATLIMGLLLYFYPAGNLFILIILSAVIYFLALYLLGGISKNEVFSLIKKEV